VISDAVLVEGGGDQSCGLVLFIGRFRMTMEETAQFDGLGDDPFHQPIEAVTAEHRPRLSPGIRNASKAGHS
jgi:hypothetical protein